MANVESNGHMTEDIGPSTDLNWCGFESTSGSMIRVARLALVDWKGSSTPGLTVAVTSCWTTVIALRPCNSMPPAVTVQSHSIQINLQNVYRRLNT